MKKRHIIGLTTFLIINPILDKEKLEIKYLEAKPYEKKEKFRIKRDYKILIEEIIKKESNNNPYAYNTKSHARGLMQITPVVLKEWNSLNKEKYNEKDLFNKEINKKIGTWYLNRIINHYLPNYNLKKSLENILTAYNWGIGNLKKIKDAKKNANKLPLETKDYIKKIKRNIIKKISF